MKFWFFGAIFIVWLLGSLSMANAGESLPPGRYLSAAEVVGLFPGQFIAHFKGYVVQVRANPDGGLESRYQGLGDRGTWQVSGRSLCVSLQSWMNGEQRCSAVIQYGPWYQVADVLFRPQ